jgi:hypothetical protein
MEELKARLSKYGIDISRFGQGSAKSLEHLFREIESGETQLVEENGRLIRRVSVLAVDVFHEVDGDRLRLKEDRQVFADGRVRRRSMPTSIGEKLRIEEDPLEAIARALKEELGISKFDVLTPVRTTTTMEESPSYPGILSKYSSHELGIVIDPTEYREEGYTEIQTDKTTYFIWTVDRTDL